MLDMAHLLDENMITLAEELAISEHELLVLIAHGAMELGISFHKVLEKDIDNREFIKMKLERIDKFVTRAAIEILLYDMRRSDDKIG